MNLSRPFIERPIATTLITLGIALAGALAYTRLPIAPLPQVDFPTISVSANLPGASPETMASTIATPLERALGSIAGVNELTSTSSLGSTRVTLQFDLNRDIDGAARDVQAAINAARTLLPSGLPSNPSYRKVNPADAPIMIVSLTSATLTVGQMYDAASTVLAQRLSQVGGVGQVQIGGGALPAVRVELDPNRLASNGIAIDDVRVALTATNANRPKGAVEDATRSWQIGASDQAYTAAAYAPMILRYRNGNAVRLADVAQVQDSVQDIRNYGTSNGRPAVLLIVYKQPGANIIDAVDNVRALLPQLTASIPAAIDMNVVIDRTPTIRASLTDVQRTLAISIGLVILVVLLFLRNVRAALIPSVAVPISLAGTFCVMYLCGYSLDNLSAMALTVATGFVVDDAIVVLENITRHTERGMAPRAAALRGAREIGFTVVSISISLIAVFLPILLMGGVVGRLFREFAVVLSSAILVSMVVSLTTTPMMAAALLRPPKVEQPGRVSLWALAAQRRVLRGYRGSLAWTLRHQPLVLLLLAGVIALNVVLYASIPKTFFPDQDTGRLNGFIQADQGISFQAMQEKLDTFLAIIRSDPAVDSATGFTGGGQRNSAFLFVSLKAQSERKVSMERIVDRVRIKSAHVPGAVMYLFGVQDLRIGGRQSNAQYQYTLQADSLAELQVWEPKVRLALQGLPELTDVNSDQQVRGLQTSLVIDRDAATRLGLTVNAIDTALNDAFGQRQVGVIYNPLNQYRVIMELEPRFLQSPEALRSLYLSPPGVPASGVVSTLPSSGAASAAGDGGTSSTATTGNGAPAAQVPLSAVARIESTLTPLAVNHQSGTPATTVSFNLPIGVSLSQATEAINRTVLALGPPVSVRGSFAGSAQAFQASLSSQPLLILAAMVAVYLVLGILYESLTHPLTILSTLPSAGVGALLALMLLNTEFSIIALIGVILLIGIVKKNAIMMIDVAIHLQRDAGMTAGPAIYRAAMLRVRPILMTTMAAMLGAVPLAVGFGDGSELRRPLGIAIVGGLFLSQLLTLYTTPVVFVCLERVRQRVLRGRARRRDARPHPTTAAAPSMAA